MKIIIINGSPRANGATGTILKNIKNTLEAQDSTLEIELVELGKLDMKLCTGCLACYKTGECYIKDDGLETLSKKIEEAHGVVFASPTYGSNVSGHFKILIDRGHFVFEQLLRDKACFSVVTYANADGTSAMKIINHLIQVSGGSVVDKILYKTNHNSKEPYASSKIENKCSHFLKRVKSGSPLTLPQKLFRSIIVNVGLKPYVFKNPGECKGILKRWQKIGLITEKEAAQFESV
jgi:multimeric flavodoxin WrbA